MTYGVSYMHLRVNEDVTVSNFVWVNSFTVASQGLFMVLGGLLEKRVGPKLTCLLGCTIFSAGIMLTYFSIKYSLVTVFLTYGVMAGFGTAVAYASPLACGMRWFPKRKGLINGLIVGGFGLGALLSTTIQTYFLNPDNISPDSDGYFKDDSLLNRVPYVFFLLGCVFILMEYVGCILISTPTKDMDDAKCLIPEEDGQTQLNTTANSAIDLGPKQVLRNKLFYMLWFIYMFNGIAISYVSAMYKTFGQTFIKDDHFLAMVGSLAALFNASGRILWGRIMDKTSFKTTLRILSTLFSILLCTIPLTKHMGKPGYTVWVWCIYLTFSGIFAIMPTVTEKAFGSKNYAANFGLIFSCQAVSSPLMAVLNQLMLDAIGFTGSFLTMAGVVLLAVGMSFFVPNGL
ncbi:oxalate:formate antiporter-like isoform X2 [Palaemon carinicauda]